MVVLSGMDLIRALQLKHKRNKIALPGLSQDSGFWMSVRIGEVFANAATIDKQLWTNQNKTFVIRTETMLFLVLFVCLFVCFLKNFRLVFVPLASVDDVYQAFESPRIRMTKQINRTNTFRV